MTAPEPGRFEKKRRKKLVSVFYDLQGVGRFTSLALFKAAASLPRSSDRFNCPLLLLLIRLIVEEKEPDQNQTFSLFEYKSIY